MNKVAQIIAAELEQTGSISFARFMRLALYCPDYGYYEAEEDTVGAGGDFFTSVSVGRLFGELLASQFSEWLRPELLGATGAGSEGPAVQLVEAGAHNGRLARDILEWMRRWRPEIFARVEYWIVEPSGRRRGWQQQQLAGLSGKVRWAADLETLQTGCGGVRGVIFSNELLDAMPVHRLGWDAAARSWFEWGVQLKEGSLDWIRLENPGSGIRDSGPENSGEPGAGAPRPQVPAELLEVLPDGVTVEVCPEAERWWRRAAASLNTGRLVTLDYGLLAGERFLPERREGTLRAYDRHRVSSDLLARPGEQDLTAHVDFGLLQAAGESAGLKTDILETQERFLTGIAAGIWKGERPFAPWTSQHTRQFRTLTHPEHLGRAFRALVQSRG